MDLSRLYKLKTQPEKIGAIELQVECLKDLNETIDELFKELERSGNAALLEELCPYFGTVWPSARALAEVISSQKLQGLRILEIGCGLAIPSLVAAKLGAHVVATDFHPEVPRFLERNKILNQVSDIEYVRVDWQTGFPDLGSFDLIIGSDVLYERAHAELLVKVLTRYMDAGCRAIIADPARPYLQAFVDGMTKAGFKHETRIVTALDTPVPKDIFIVELSRLGQM